MALKIKTAGLHEAKRFRNSISQFNITPRLRAIFDESEHPLSYACQVGVAALREGTQQIECCGRLSIRLNLTARIGSACFISKGDVIDDIASVARQFFSVTLFTRRGTRLCKLTRNSAYLHHRRSSGVGQHHRHLQKHPEEIADIIRAMFGKAFRAIATLQQESFALRDTRQLLLETARLA